jgi:transcriptional regulator with XRE-family HTH domain
MAVCTAAPGYGARIRRARLEVNKTRRQLAGAVGVHYNSVGRYEREEAIPHDGVLIAIAQVTRTTASWLLYGDEEKE